MTQKRIQLYENFPDIGETKYVLPKPSFNDVYSNPDYGFFSLTRNTNFMDMSKWDKAFRFKFLHGKSEYDNDPMTYFKRTYIHNELDSKSLGSSGKYFWDNGSGAYFGKDHSPTKKIGYYTGMEIPRDNSDKVDSGSWNNGRVMPIRGCVGWSGYIEIETEYTSSHKSRYTNLLGLYVVLCNQSQQIRIAELVGVEESHASSRDTDFYGKSGTVAKNGGKPSTYLASSNVKDPYCNTDNGVLHYKQGSVHWGSRCSESSFYSPKNTQCQMTYCFSKATQQKIYNEKWVPIGMFFYVGMYKDGKPATTKCTWRLKRNKLLYRPQNAPLSHWARPSYWGDLSTTNYWRDIKDYENDKVEHSSLMLCPEVVPLKNYWSAINSSKRKIASVNF